MSDQCRHGIVERHKGKLVINTMTDYIPVDFCPNCGKKLSYTEIEKERGQWD